MFGIFSRARIALLLDKAYQAAAHAHYENALKNIEAAEDAGLSKYVKPWTKVSAQVYLLKAFLQIKLHRYAEALEILIELQKFFLSRRKQTSELLYLECYASVLARTPLMSQELKYTDLAMQGFKIFKTPYEVVDLDSVPKNVKRKFPIPSHPAWKQKS